MNAQNLAKYHARAPRYILNTNDEALIRVAGPYQLPWEEGTEIKDISLTGLSFMAPSDLCPILGEVIKIQFIPPGAQQLACYGIVTRLQDHQNQQSTVAVHFHKMDMNQRILLAQGLSRKYQENTQRRKLEKALYEPVEGLDLKKIKPKSIFLFFFALILWTVVLFFYLRWQGHNGSF
ncbi:MAG: PilZ domain-containing protein [Pseudobdellovibrionaceae bacterium]